MQYFVYIVQCRDGTYYTGTALNLAKRIAAHNDGKGAKYTRSRRPVSLMYSESCASRGAALSREAALKRLTRTQKHTLVGAYRKQRR